MTSTGLVVLSLTSWGEVRQRSQHLLLALLRSRREYRVLYVEPARSPWRSLARLERPLRGRGLRPVHNVPGLATSQLWRYEPTNWFIGPVEQAADDALTAQVRRAVARISMTAPTLWIDDPQQGAVLLAQTGWPALYDLHGDLLAGGPVSANEERLLASEDFVLREVQEVVSTSSALAQGKTTDRPVTIIPNAADVDVFRRPAPRPPDLPQRPVVLVTGMIHRERLDLSLCARTGRALAADGARLVLVGPVFLHASERTLLEAADVLLLGERPYPQMPAYLQAADVLAAPFAANDFTTSLDPVGLYEYAAIGSPVVATTVAQTWEAHRDVVTADGDEFVGAVREALAAGRADGRGPGPDVPTWDERVDQLHSVISRLRGVTSTP